MTDNGSALDISPNLTSFKRAHPETSETLKRSNLVREEDFPQAVSEIDFKVQPYSYGDSVKAFWYFRNLRELSNSCTPGYKVSPSQINSDWFSTGSDEQWRVLIVPKNKTSTSVGFFIERKAELNTPERSASVSVTVYSNSAPEFYSRVHALHVFETFDYYCSDWGSPKLLDINRNSAVLGSPLLFEVNVIASPMCDRSREITGYVGLVNEGTTCYLNSLLQTLFFIRKFRLAVFAIPICQDTSRSVANSLQQVFKQLEISQSAVSTRVVYEALGWQATELHTQHDIQEFNFKLCDILEASMRGTLVEGTYPELFEGETVTRISCSQVNLTSTRTERFFDLQLDVKDCKDLYRSLDRYTAEEHLVGDNQYSSEQFGKQDAVKDVKFSRLPPVLQILLKRFEINPVTGQSSKINDLFEFDPEIDLSKYSVGEQDCTYKLFSVIVHSGNAHNGHYFAYINPSLKGNWYNFNDSSVDIAFPSKAIDSNFGGTTQSINILQGKLMLETEENESNAYMLVYIQASQADVVVGREL
jgi:ubiquitin carboxyl-terminal hydrolase 7